MSLPPVDKKLIISGEEPKPSHIRKKSASDGSASPSLQRNKIFSPNSSPCLRRPFEARREDGSSHKNEGSVGKAISDRGHFVESLPRKASEPGIKSPRNYLSKRKGRILKLHPSYIKLLSQQEILEEISKLQRQIEEAESGTSRQTMHVEQSSLLPQLLARLKELQEESLVDLIVESNDIYNMQACLRLSPQSIIEPVDLFSAILSQIEKGIHSEEKIAEILSFCQCWARENRETTYFSLVKNRLEAIRRSTSEAPSLLIRSFSQALKTTLDVSEEAVKEDVPKTESVIDFEKETLANLNEENVQEAVEDVAHDLLIAQVQLYCRTSPDDLIKKWNTQSGYGAAVDGYRLLVNQIDSYIKKCLFSQEDFDKRIMMIRFFLDVANASLKLEDYATAHAIYSTFANGVITTQMKKSMNCAHRNEILEKLGKLFNVGKQATQALHARMQRCNRQEKPYIALQTSCLSEVSLIDEKSAVTEEGFYNVDKLFNIRRKISEYFGLKNYWIKSQLFKSAPKSNFIAHYLASSPFLADAELERLAEKFSDQEVYNEKELEEIRAKLKNRKKYSEKEVARIIMGYRQQNIISEDLIAKITSQLSAEKMYTPDELTMYISSLRKK